MAEAQIRGLPTSSGSDAMNESNHVSKQTVTPLRPVFEFLRLWLTTSSTHLFD